MTHKTMTPTTTFSPMMGEEEYLAPYHPTTMPGKSTIPIVDIFSEEATNNEFPSQSDLMTTEYMQYLKFANPVMAAVTINLIPSVFRMMEFYKNDKNLKALYDHKQDIFKSDKKVFLEFMRQKHTNLKNCYSLSSAEYSSGLKALDVFKKFNEDLQDTAINSIMHIFSQRNNERVKARDYYKEKFGVFLIVVGLGIGSEVAMLAVHYFSGKTVMELLSDTIDQVSAGVSSVAQTMGGVMELASETMDRWLAGANGHSEYEFELDGAATDVAGADCPVFIEDALLADGAVPVLIVYPQSIAL